MYKNTEIQAPLYRTNGAPRMSRANARVLRRLILALILATVVWPVCAFADDADGADADGADAANAGALLDGTNPPGAVTPVSAPEIAEGLAFCAEFPVALMLDGVPVESDAPPVIIRGRTLIPARALFERMGASVSWNGEARQVGVSTTAAGIILTIDAFKYEINGNTYIADVPPLIVNDRTMVPVRIVAESMGCDIAWDDLTRTVTVSSPIAEAPTETPPDAPTDAPAFGTPVPEESQDAISRGGMPARESGAAVLPSLRPEFAGFSVVIDAGHGGVDSGALGERGGESVLFEKDVNLDVALRLETYLRGAGFNVHMIRGGDNTVDIYERPQIANALGAQLYISIHNNSSKKPEISGTSTYYYNKEWAAGYPLDSKTLALSVQKTVSAYAGLPDFGVHDGPAYIVLNRTQMPAIIVEGAFLSNASDLALMRTDAYREAYAFGVAVGLINALNGVTPGWNASLDGMMPIGL